MTAGIGAALAAGLGSLLMGSAALAQCAPGACGAYVPASPAYAVAPGYGAANRYGEGYGYVASGPCNVCAAPPYARPVVVAPPEAIEVSPNAFYGDSAGGVVEGEALGGGGGGGGTAGLGQFESAIGSASAFSSANAFSQAAALGQAYANASVQSEAQAQAYAKALAKANAQSYANANASASASSSSSSTVNIYPQSPKGCSKCSSGGNQGWGNKGSMGWSSMGGGVGGMGGGHTGGHGMAMNGWGGGVGSMGGHMGGGRHGCGCGRK